MSYIEKKTVELWMTGWIIGHLKQRLEKIVNNLLKACNQTT